MLHAALAQCPTLGGKVKILDSAVAEKMPGVRECCSTDSGVVVVADHYWQALRARNALEITWDPGPNTHLDNAAISALLEKNRRTRAEGRARAEGDAAAALKTARQTLRAVYELPLFAHATMEPMNCTADVKADGCDLYVGHAGAADVAGRGGGRRRPCAHPGPGFHHLDRRRLRPAPRSRFHSSGGRGFKSGRGAGEIDLDPRGRHDS